MPDEFGNALPGEVGYVEPTQDTTQDTTSTAGALSGATQPDSISAMGADVAQATGSTFNSLPKPDTGEATTEYDAASTATSLGANAKVASGISTDTEAGFVDANKSTVAGQLSALFSADNPYIQQANLAGERKAAERGMLNSSMAAGASRAAAIQAGLPIAQQDAQTYANAQSKEQEATYKQTATQTEGIVSGALSVQNAEIAKTATRIQQEFQAAMQGATEQNKVYLQDMQNQHQTFLSEMEVEHQLNMQRENTTAAKNEMISTQSSAIMQNYQITVENMMTNPDFLNLGTEAVNKAIANAQTLARNSLKFVGATAGVEGFNTIVDWYIQDVDAADQINIPAEATA